MNSQKNLEEIDKYLFDLMSQEDKEAFELRLKEDKELRVEFSINHLTIKSFFLSMSNVQYIE